MIISDRQLLILYNILGNVIGLKSGFAGYSQSMLHQLYNEITAQQSADLIERNPTRPRVLDLKEMEGESSPEPLLPRSVPEPESYTHSHD